MTPAATSSEKLPPLIQASKESSLGVSSPSDADSRDESLESSTFRVTRGQNEESQDAEVATDVDTREDSSNVRINDMKNEDGRSSNAFIHQKMADKVKTDSNGIPLTPDQLEHAKDIVLDLLGWGVEPEYLVHIGVSSRTIYRIFTDLNLRLPRNLALCDS
ncbi:hypothetical protein K435DRAFT_864383 [Dendrothele bispora CBS 962.96]|uniref:Uncharacterized protein n=1 Tax=Dendrothele bispora (strain CBS 962.96) TaxID=1314807 RepID=A0A4S8LM36_DENBC|nr:hypothetical protein K435DRAFT_864383 [Dendrothele bispora CBS 962.96]